MGRLGYSGKTVFVYGLGNSGRVAAMALQEDGSRVLAWDDREQNRPHEMTGVSQITLCPPEEVDWTQVEAVLKSPGIPMSMPVVNTAQQAGVPIIGDIDLLYSRQKGCTFIGITGTNGKSTTTALIAHVLSDNGFEVACGGNLGTPALALPDVGPEGIYVLEVSSFQLEMMHEAAFDSAILLNMTPDHLDRHGTMEEYLNAKLNIFHNSRGVRVLGIDNAILQQAAPNIPNVTTVSVQGNRGDINVTREGKLIEQGRELADLSYFDNLPGQHNWQNIACSFAALRPWLKPDQVFSSLRSFVGLPHRLERVHALGNVRFINDSKATNGEAALHALRSFRNIYWIIGGIAKEDGLQPCMGDLHNVRAAFTIGQAGPELGKELQHSFPVFECGTLEHAVREAYASAVREGLDVAHVLLSPACASYDQFDSFEHRGDIFANRCRELTPVVSSPQASEREKSA